MEILPQLVWHYDEPFADSSAVPTWYVSQLTRQHVTVALTGDGGDELFAGYPRYRAVWLAEPLRPAAGPGAADVMAGRFWQQLPASARQKTIGRRLEAVRVEMLARTPARRYLEWIAIFGEAGRAELYSDEFVASLVADPVEFLAAGLARAAGRDPVTAFSLADLVTYLPCDLMTKVDIASMAHGLECRQPFLDYRVVELAARMPVR